MSGGDTLHPVSGCARCADLFSAYLLGADVLGKIDAHLTNHEYGRSIYPEVNALAAAAAPQEDTP